MKKRLLLLLVIPLLITGCNKNKTSSEIVSNVTSIETSLDVTSLSSEKESTISKEESTSISTSEEVTTSEYSEIVYTLEEVKQKALTLKANVNKFDIAESNIGVSIDLKLLARFDFIGSKEGMGSNYHLLMSDGNDYIYVKVSKEVYLKGESRIGSVWHIDGNVSYYCGTPEITSKATSIVEVNKIIESNEVYQDKSIRETFEIIDDMTLNCKGCNAGQLLSIKAEYYAKMDDVVALFRQGNDIIFVHGPAKWLNGMSIGKTYQINGVPNMRNFRPGFECLDKKEISASIDPIDETKLNKVDQSIYSIKYEVEKNPTYPNYSNLFKKLMIIEGFVNYYMKDGKYYTVIDFTAKENVYNAYTNACQGKALFIKNEEATRLSNAKDDSYNPFSPYYAVDENDNPIKISFIGVPYLWNTQGYWQVYALADTIIDL